MARSDHSGAEGPEERVQRRFAQADMSSPVSRALLDAALERELRLGDDAWEPPAPPPLSWSQGSQLKAEQAPLGPLETIHERIRLPPLPSVLLRLQEIMSDPGADADEFARALSLDPRLSASVISLVNSPFYGLPFKVESLSRAVAVLGLRRVSALALGARILSMFEDGPSPGIPLRAFWIHSAATALMAHHLALWTGRTEPDRYSLAGQLHDLGRLPLYSSRPKLAKAALSLHRHWGAPLDAAERQLFDLDHAMLGGLYMKRWGLPDSWVHAALNHHDARRCLGRDVSEVVFVANQIATALGLGCNRIYCSEAGEEVWASLGVKPADVETLTRGFDEELDSVFRAMFGGADG
ncbi:MAG: HDOD domain-containing protein [Desulfovibrionaceae bacterium]